MRGMPSSGINIIGDCNGTHTAEDFIRFLRKIDKACVPKKVLHIVADNIRVNLQ
jgi:hypothetical protein